MSQGIKILGFYTCFFDSSKIYYLNKNFSIRAGRQVSGLDIEVFEIDDIISLKIDV